VHMLGAALEVSVLEQRDGASVVFGDRRRARLDEAQLRCELASTTPAHSRRKTLLI